MKVKLDMIGIVVEDIAESLKFYGLLGLDVPKSFEGPYCEMTLDGGIRLSWNALTMVKELGPWVQPVGHRNGLAFLCDSSTSVDSKHAELVSAGYENEKEPWDAFWGQRYAQVKDPDGNVVDLFAPLG